MKDNCWPSSRVSEVAFIWKIFPVCSISRFLTPLSNSWIRMRSANRRIYALRWPKEQQHKTCTTERLTPKVTRSPETCLLAWDTALSPLQIQSRKSIQKPKRKLCKTQTGENTDYLQKKHPSYFVSKCCLAKVSSQVQNCIGTQIAPVCTPWSAEAHDPMSSVPQPSCGRELCDTNHVPWGLQLPTTNSQQ